MYEWGGVRQLYGSHSLTTSFLCACLEISHKSRLPATPSKVSASCFLCACWGDTWEEIVSPGFQLNSLNQNSWFHLIYVLREIQAMKDVLWKKVIPNPNSEQAILEPTGFTECSKIFNKSWAIGDYLRTLGRDCLGEELQVAGERIAFLLNVTEKRKGMGMIMPQMIACSLLQLRCILKKKKDGETHLIQN